jgi:hypothetical protein
MGRRVHRPLPRYEVASMTAYNFFMMFLDFNALLFVALMVAFDL